MLPLIGQGVKRASKIGDVLKKARECLDNGRYLDTSHAALRKQQRQISLTHVHYVIRNGYHEKRKDQYQPEYDDWTYAIRGKNIDGRDLRIAIAFDDDDMLIITVIEITRGEH